MNSVSRNQIHSSHTTLKRYRGDYDDQSIRPYEYSDYRQLNHGVMVMDVLCIPRIVPTQCLQNSDFNLTSVSILLDSPDDFDGDFTSTFDIPSFDDFTECPLT
jgi:hypothetical protein